MAKLRSLADSLDDYARKIRAIGDSLDDCVRQIRSIAEIIRSVEDEKSVQASVENTAAIPSSENNPSISRHSASAPSRDSTALVGWRPLPPISNKLVREAREPPVVDSIEPEAVLQSILGGRNDVREIESALRRVRAIADARKATKPLPERRG
jgi:hypothetical protein